MSSLQRSDCDVSQPKSYNIATPEALVNDAAIATGLQNMRTADTSGVRRADPPQACRSALGPPTALANHLFAKERTESKEDDRRTRKVLWESERRLLYYFSMEVPEELSNLHLRRLCEGLFEHLGCEGIAEDPRSSCCRKCARVRRLAEERRAKEKASAEQEAELLSRRVAQRASAQRRDRVDSSIEHQGSTQNTNPERQAARRKSAPVPEKGSLQYVLNGPFADRTIDKGRNVTTPQKQSIFGDPNNEVKPRSLNTQRTPEASFEPNRATGFQSPQKSAEGLPVETEASDMPPPSVALDKVSHTNGLTHDDEVEQTDAKTGNSREDLSSPSKGIDVRVKIEPVEGANPQQTRDEPPVRRSTRIKERRSLGK
ncbi:MAG: hypothetical protein M1828_003929 [Chrysothrix sp. TS-e1954]|nr:MAG: hypothetical protein M1828_003929 [Chrysothrix sp. TS-e1954]